MTVVLVPIPIFVSRSFFFQCLGKVYFVRMVLSGKIRLQQRTGRLLCVVLTKSFLLLLSY